MNIYFDNLPIEMRMMVFDHLVTDKYSLGTICLVSHNWRIITQNSYSWKLWINALIGKKSQPEDIKYILGQAENIFYPIYDIQFALNDIVPHRVKTLLTKKFLFFFFGL